ncbi:hypothetical protein ACQ4LE_008265 [Meloidogyne hapla]|uniref:DB domain-containing protein n=1 Tax=Meloidogyne hapla TaxID=6305 RepID=A0A1I8B7F4_MELHA
MQPKLILYLIIVMLIVKSSLSDLPSCIRAKCVHCKVYFIAQMCPIACSSCPTTTEQPTTQQNRQQNFLTALKPAINSEEVNYKAFSQATIIVPFAQQIPTNLNRNKQRTTNDLQRPTNLSPQQKQYQRNRNQQHGTVLRKQPQLQNFQYKQEQPQYTFVQPFQQQQTQNYVGGGGFYGGPTQYPIPPPPPPTNFQPLEIQREQQQQFNNPFQPFMQQSYQSMQQFQQPISLSSPPSIPPQQNVQQFFEQQNSQNGQLPPIQFPNNQQVVQNNVPQQTQLPSILPQQIYNQPMMSIDERPSSILHAVPNVAKSQQNFQKLYNIPQLQPIDGKGGNGWADEKSLSTINNKIREPGADITGNSIFSGGESGEKCPKQNWEPCVPKELANRRFQNCCSQLGEGCTQLCSYDQNLTNIQLAVLTGRCPINKVADMMLCASGYEDATPCCQEFNVFEAGFEHCRPYCNPAGGLPNDGMLVEKYKCLQKLQQIQKCFYLSQRP